MYSIYTDGACRGNGKSTNVGGWGFVVHNEDTQDWVKKDWGGEANTTNNRMELTAAIKGVEYVRYCRIESTDCKLYTDSTYVQKGLTEWMTGWKKKDFKGVKNEDLWRRLVELNAEELNWNWVKAHADSFLNNVADELANKGCDSVNIEIKKPNTFKADFISAMLLIYHMDVTSASELFEEYSKATAHDYHNTSNRIFVEMKELHG